MSKGIGFVRNGFQCRLFGRLQIMKLLLFAYTLLLFSNSSFAESNFRFFETWEGAREFIIEEHTQDVKNSFKEENISFLDLAQDRETYGKVEKITDRLMASFRALYPEVVSENRNPRVLILNSEAFQASAFRGTNIIILSKKVVNRSDEEIQGIMAHELAHLLIQGEHFATKFYISNPERVLFGEEIRENSQIREFVKTLKFRGPFFNEELAGIPVDGRIPETQLFTWGQLLGYLLTKAPDTEACQEAMSLRDKFFAKIKGNFLNADTETWDISQNEKNDVHLMSVTLEESLKSCLVGIRYSYGELIEGVSGFPGELSLKMIEAAKISRASRRDEDVSLMSASERFDENLIRVSGLFEENDAVDVILSETSQFRLEMREDLGLFPVSRIRFYTDEDFADEVATKVLYFMGYSPAGHNQLIGPILRDEEFTCEEEEGVEPYYGSLNKGHHASCWRRFRNNRYYSKLLNEGED